MKINISLFLNPDAEERLIQVEAGSSLEALAKQYQPEVPYRILAAKVDNRVRELTVTLEEPCRVTFLDMRTSAANLIYQRSVSFIYLKAVYDVLGITQVVIENSLNKGLYTSIKGRPPVTAEEVAAIEARMHEIVAEDIPFIRTMVPKEEALKLLSDGDYAEKRRLLQNADSVVRLPLYNCDGFVNFFYGKMAPSAGYIEHFELRKYRNGVLLRFPEPAAPDRLPPYRDDALLYQAFGEAYNWHQLMGIPYVAQLREAVESGRIREIIQISEALHEKKIAQIADSIKTQKKRIILIAGPSSSGKTTFAQRLRIQLKVNGLDPIYLGTDDYFVEREETPLDEKGEPNFEDIVALDIGLFTKQMNALLAGEEVDIPVFNFITGKKVFGTRKTRLKPGQPIVIEGIHGLNHLLTAGIPDEEKFKIYISPMTQLSIDNHNRIPTTDARMLRRIVRDNRTRGHSAQRTIAQWPKVRAGEEKNIFPFNGEADVLFNSVHIYELAVLKKYAEPLLAEIKSDCEEFAEAQRMLRFLRYFPVLEDDSVIVNNSILREFIGGSIFVD